MIQRKKLHKDTLFLGWGQKENCNQDKIAILRTLLLYKTVVWTATISTRAYIWYLNLFSQNTIHIALSEGTQ